MKTFAGMQRIKSDIDEKNHKLITNSFSMIPPMYNMPFQPLTRLMLLLLSVVLLSACDPGVLYNQIVQNDSSHDIWFYTYGSRTEPNQPAPVLDSTLVPAGVTSSIYEYAHLGTVGLFTACRSYEYDSLSSTVVSSDPLKLSINLNQPANWRYTVIDEALSGGGSCECRIVIDDGMLE